MTGNNWHRLSLFTFISTTISGTIGIVLIVVYGAPQPITTILVLFNLVATVLSFVAKDATRRAWLRESRAYLQSRYEAPQQARMLIGDPSCQYNALSRVLRCAVNPDGPCDHCPHYQPRSIQK